MSLRATLAVAALLTLAACSSGSPEVAAPTATSSAPSPQDELSAAPMPPTGVPAADAVDVAHESLLVYIDHGLTPEDWYARLAPHLSEAARVAYAGTDPTQVPVRQLNGEPVLAPSTSVYLAGVQWQTDIGPVTVELSRRLGDGGWQVERFVLPEGAW